MIGGNTMAEIQYSSKDGLYPVENLYPGDTLYPVGQGITRNEIGERVQSWETVAILTGWLDLQAGDSKYTTYNAKIQESTHVFIADYVPLNALIRPENSRMIVNGNRYDVMLIDDPMGLHKQLEIYLKYTGGQ